MNARQFLIAVTGLATALLAACSSRVPDVVTIGVAVPLSGPQAGRGKDLLDGVQLAVKELNAKGVVIDGKAVTLEVKAMDDKADKAVAAGVAQALVDAKVHTVVGHLSSDISEVAIPIYKKGNLPQLFTSSARNLTTLAEGNGFRLVANDDLQALAMASFVTTMLPAKKVSMIYEDTAFGRPVSKAVAEGLAKGGATVAINQGFDNKTTQFDALVAKLKTDTPEVLIAVMREHQLLPLFQQMKAAGVTNLAVVVTNSAKTTKMASTPHPFKSLHATSNALDAFEFERTGQEFLTRFRAQYKAEPVWGAHYAYDATYVLVGAMQKAASVEPEKLRAALKVVDIGVPATGSMRFSESGERSYAPIAVYVANGGKWDMVARSDVW